MDAQFSINQIVHKVNCFYIPRKGYFQGIVISSKNLFERTQTNTACASFIKSNNVYLAETVKRVYFCIKIAHLSFCLLNSRSIPRRPFLHQVCIYKQQSYLISH